ncbi:PREDICTED: annexin A3 [Gekko japonicus]|uniref:Annexin n=1 Tax=Gekko japonicus TaxID=146911 RepID=A0ABM1JNH5_GEKJA|nr:PREDICTED: annexin A3 [Gekko japonicus]
MASAWIGNRGTVRDTGGFNAAREAEIIWKAIRGGEARTTIFSILTSRTNAQRQLIAGCFREGSGKDLKDVLRDELSGDVKHLMVALVIPPAVFDAQLLYRALKGPGTDEEMLIEVLASRNNWQMKDIVQTYCSIYNRSLRTDISSDTSGNFRKALINLTHSRRSESPIVDAHLAKNDAQVLYSAGEKKWGTDEDRFTEILCFSSLQQLKKTFSEYQKLSGMTIEDTIKRETSGQYRYLLLAIVKCARSTPAFFAEKLRRALKGVGTDEATLNRVMVSRSEIDLWDVRTEYKRLSGHSLYSAIQSDTSGDYRTALLRICGGDD